MTWGAKRLRLAVEAAGVALFSWNVDNDLFEMDDRSFSLWGLTPSGAVRFEALSGHIHPLDTATVRAAFAATCAIGGEYEIDFRVTTAADTRWISARGKGNDSGIVDRVMFGIFLDVSDRKQAEESHELLAGEMSDRVKNLLAIASGLTAITARSSASAPEMAKSLTHRLVALGRAHDLTRHVPNGQAQGALLADLLSVLLAPYVDDGDFSGRVRVTMPKTRVSERAATSLALVIHKLATNSLKYGSLSTPTGTLDLSHFADGDDFGLVWTERGGPPVSAPTGPGGFGTTLIRRSMAGQLGGAIEYDWLCEGSLSHFGSIQIAWCEALLAQFQIVLKACWMKLGPSASWINQVERWFAELTRKQLRRGVYTSTSQLEQDTRTFIERHNENPKPYRWTKSGVDPDLAQRQCYRSLL